MNHKEMKGLLSRNLDRIGVEQKKNFSKLIENFIEKNNESLINNTSVEEIKKEVLYKIFVLLNRSNHKRKKRTSSPLTAMYGNRTNGLYQLYDYPLNDLKTIAQSDFFSSITGMQNGKGMINKTDFQKLIERCTFDDKLDRQLLSSITGMQNGKGMINEVDFQKLIERCTFDNKLDTKILSSITGMQGGKGMINEADFQKLIERCTFDNKLDTKILKSITGMQAGKGMINEADFDQFIIKTNKNNQD